MELDLVSESADQRTALIGECKWTEQVNPVKELDSLRTKTANLPWLKDRNIRYALFTRQPIAAPAQLDVVTAEEVASCGL